MPTIPDRLGTACTHGSCDSTPPPGSGSRRTTVPLHDASGPTAPYLAAGEALTTAAATTTAMLIPYRRAFTTTTSSCATDRTATAS